MNNQSLIEAYESLYQKVRDFYAAGDCHLRGDQCIEKQNGINNL